MKQKELADCLKGVVALGAVCVLFLGGVVAPEMGAELALGNPALAYMYWPCLIFIWVSAVPVCAALVLVWGIASEIRRDNSFCYKNAARLRAVSLLALGDTLFYLAGTGYLAASQMLHVGILILSAGVMAVGAAITVAAAALSHLTKKAADLKSENDLTI